MPAVCSAYGCTNRSNKTTDLSYYKLLLFLIMLKGIFCFRFPLKNEELTKKWVDALRRDKWYPTPASYLCSAHFSEKCTYKTNNQRRLFASAVPTKLFFSEHLKKNG
ncbi:hypothetical protein PR048_017581 [Dryococelus australis]|uniref:THAP-type domain-containing protein n=1 Tax=Dryococelus australis TaxID=614101 RepID=A0ABQ9HAH6_9NEOP|nr:hypothetical protein PR048_017581 [Dryococelus australis]